MSKVVPFVCHICEREIGNPSTDVHVMFHPYECSICKKTVCSWHVKFKERVCEKCFEKKI